MWTQDPYYIFQNDIMPRYGAANVDFQRQILAGHYIAGSSTRREDFPSAEFAMPSKSRTGAWPNPQSARRWYLTATEIPTTRSTKSAIRWRVETACTTVFERRGAARRQPVQLHSSLATPTSDTGLLRPDVDMSPASTRPSRSSLGHLSVPMAAVQRRFGPCSAAGRFRCHQIRSGEPMRTSPSGIGNRNPITRAPGRRGLLIRCSTSPQRLHSVADYPSHDGNRPIARRAP